MSTTDVTPVERTAQRPLSYVLDTWHEDGAFCAFSQEAVAVCKSERADNRPKVLKRSTSWESVREVAFAHRREHPTHRVTFEITQVTVITTPVQE